MNGKLTLHPKVAGGTLSGALGIVIVWGFGLAHIVVPDPVAGALVLLFTFVGGWLAPTLIPPASPNEPPAL